MTATPSASSSALHSSKMALASREFTDRSDHREHDAELAVNGSTAERTQLGFEDVGAIEAQTDGTVAQERVHFFREFEVGQTLVAADIERADYDFLALHRFEYLFVYLELLFLPLGSDRCPCTGTRYGTDLRLRRRW